MIPFIHQRLRPNKLHENRPVIICWLQIFQIRVHLTVGKYGIILCKQRKNSLLPMKLLEYHFVVRFIMSGTYSQTFHLFRKLRIHFLPQLYIFFCTLLWFDHFFPIQIISYRTFFQYHFFPISILFCIISTLSVFQFPFI